MNGVTCPRCGSRDVKRFGTRELKRERIQRYACRGCGRVFSDKKLEHKSYPPRIILSGVCTKPKVICSTKITM